jgi:hypothetical protein
VGELKLGQSLHVRDIEFPGGSKPMASPDAIVASVRLKAAAVEVTAPTEEAATQPEIIGRKEKVEEGEEETKEKEKK